MNLSNAKDQSRVERLKPLFVLVRAVFMDPCCLFIWLLEENINQACKENLRNEGKKQRRKRTLQLLQKCWSQSCEKCQLSHKPPCPSFPAETCYVSKGQRSLPAYDYQHNAEYTVSCPAPRHLSQSCVLEPSANSTSVLFQREAPVFS